MESIAGKKEELLFGNSPIHHEEKFLLEMFSQISDRLKTKFNYSEDDIRKICYKEGILIPVYIFSGNLSPAEALSKFLKEHYELDYSKIAEITGRDVKSVWANYKRASKKMPWAFENKEGVSMPASAFNPELSTLENVISYLKNNMEMSNKKIAGLLNKNPSNVWSLNKRASKKRGKNDRKE